MGGTVRTTKTANCCDRLRVTDARGCGNWRTVRLAAIRKLSEECKSNRETAIQDEVREEREAI